MKRILLFFVAGVTGTLLVGCASLSPTTSSPPPNPNNLCSIFKKNPSWYKRAHTSSKRWHVPIQVMMAIMRQESSFIAHAKPKRSWFLFIPLPRSSSAYGYAQAQDPTWNDYKSEAAQSWLPSRNKFSDAIDFIGWYISKTKKINKISPWDVANVYLNYHDGWGGFKRGTWKEKPWLIKVAKRVAHNANTYGWQLKKCPFT